MATLSLESADILPDGRVLKLVFAVSPVPASHALPDWQAGYEAGARVTLSTGAPLEFIGAWSEHADFGQPQTIAPDVLAGGTLPTGIYKVAYTLSDGRVSPIGSYTINAVGKVIAIIGPGGAKVPPGTTASVYLSPAGGNDASLVLHASGVAAGTATYTITSATWEDPGQPFPGFTTLRWTACYLLTDPTQVVTLGTAGVTVSAGAGLLSDRHGNTTAAASAVAVANRSLVGANGFTSQSIARGTGGVTLYVSNSHGVETGVQATDLAAGQNPATPLLTIARALAVLGANSQHGKGGAVRLLQGDTFTLVAIVGLRLGGQDATHPFVLEDYWHDFTGTGQPAPGVRPIIQGSAITLLLTSSSGGTPSPLSEVLIRRIHLKQTNTTNNLVAPGLQLFQDGTGWTIDDCLIERFGVGIVVQALGSWFERVTILRTTIRDSFGITSHSQGMYCEGVRGLLVSQCCFDTNGRKSADLVAADIFSHNLYLQLNTPTPVVWGNLIRQGGSYGAEMKGGGIAAYNVFSGNALASFLNFPGGWYYKNVIEKARDMVSTTGVVSPRGDGLEVVTQTSGTTQGAASIGVGLEFNFILNTVGTDPYCLLVDQDPASPLKGLLVRHNTARAAGRWLLGDPPAVPAPTVEHRYRRNIFTAGGRVLYQALVNPADWDWYDSDENVLHSTLSAGSWCKTVGTNQSLATWRTQTGTEADSIERAVTYADDDADLGTYYGTLGGTATEAAYVALLRDRALGIWSAAYDPSLIWAFYAAAYEPTNLDSLGTGPFDYQGAIDYRIMASGDLRIRIRFRIGGGKALIDIRY